MDQVLAILKTIYGEAVPPPRDAVVTRWTADPYARGSYSYIPVGTTPEAREALAEPVEGRIFFAGEATSRDHPGTVHGAYLSGVRAAEEILDAWA